MLLAQIYDAAEKLSKFIMSLLILEGSALLFSTNMPGLKEDFLIYVNISTEI